MRQAVERGLERNKIGQHPVLSVLRELQIGKSKNSGFLVERRMQVLEIVQVFTDDDQIEKLTPALFEIFYLEAVFINNDKGIVGRNGFSPSQGLADLFDEIALHMV